MAKREISIDGATGGNISCSTESGITRLVWDAPNGRMFGMLDNTPKTRRFLRNALKRLEKEANKAK